MGEIAEDHSAENRASTLSWAGKTLRPSRSGLLFGRVPQSNRSMDMCSVRECPGRQYAPLTAKPKPVNSRIAKIAPRRQSH
jgi:hypothetical protein